MEPYWNQSYGNGMEGMLNYANSLTDGYMGIFFLAFVWIATFVTLSRSEWKLSACASFTFFITLLTSIFLRLFMGVSDYIIFLLATGLAISVMWSLMEQR